MAMTDLTFSIVIPTYNEERDIRRTCEALVNLDYPHKEIIIVDGRSTDQTINILSEYVASSGFKLLYTGIAGVGAPRNVGILAATGDVVVILNADVTPRPDFLTRLLGHYVEGADAVSVDSEVENIQSALGRYAYAFHVFFFSGDKPVGWTEGFSCKRTAAIEAGLFPESIPVPCGEDIVFYNRLTAITQRTVIDKSITVSHVVPDDVRIYWRQQLTRGWGVPYINYFVNKRSLLFVTVRVALGTGLSVAQVLLVLPSLIRAVRLSALSPCGYRDFLAFWGIDLVRLVAGRLGHWRGLVGLVRHIRWHVDQTRVTGESP